MPGSIVMWGIVSFIIGFNLGILFNAVMIFCLGGTNELSKSEDSNEPRDTNIFFENHRA